MCDFRMRTDVRPGIYSGVGDRGIRTRRFRVRCKVGIKLIPGITGLRIRLIQVNYPANIRYGYWIITNKEEHKFQEPAMKYFVIPGIIFMS